MLERRTNMSIHEISLEVQELEEVVLFGVAVVDAADSVETYCKGGSDGWECGVNVQKK
jgi:hypothetical protein